MKLLALDTATEACSAAIWQDGQVLARFENVGRSHTERLAPMVQGIMAEAGLGFSQLEGLICGVGPGSFAGVRIGVGFAKGLALARDLPTLGVTSLELLAQRALTAGAQCVLPVIDARMNEVYYGAYGKNACRLAVDQVCPPAEVRLPAPGAWVGVGSGWKTYGDALGEAFGENLTGLDAEALPHAEDAFALVLEKFQSGKAGSSDELTPVYLRNKVALTLIEQADLRRRNSG